MGGIGGRIGLAAMVAAMAALAHAQTSGATADGAPAPASPPFTQDSTVFAPDGTAYIQRIVPIPPTVSAEARAFLMEDAAPAGPPQPPLTLAERRERAERRVRRDGNVALVKYPAIVSSATIAGVRVTRVTPLPSAGPLRPLVLINVHGGGYKVDCCSLVESVPLANLMRAEVISVAYRLAPEHPFPAGVDDVIAVYQAVLKTHPASAVAIYGTSSGAVITGEVAVALKRRGLPEPGALGIFSGFGDFSSETDSKAFFSLDGLDGVTAPTGKIMGNQRDYVGATPLTDPMLSPMKGDLSGLPPTLFLTSTRDAFLSGTSLFERAMLRAGDDAELVVFEALPHAFWTIPILPESDEADHLMARFFDRHLHADEAPAQP